MAYPMTAKRGRQVTAALVLIVTLIVVPFFHASNLDYDLSAVACFAIAVIGLNVVTGLAGQVSFATTAFMAMGGYTFALLTVREGWNSWLALAFGVLGAGIFALIIGSAVLRLRGHYLAMGTFALALVVEEFAFAANGVTGGPIGVAGIPALKIGSLDLGGSLSFYILSWTLLLLVLVGVRSLRVSRIGRAWQAVSKREDVARSLGIDVWRTKLGAFAVSAILGAIGGSLYVELTKYVSPELYGADTAVQVFAMLFIGGVGSLYGAVIGAGVVVALPLLFVSLQSWTSLLVDVVTLLVLVMMPRGISNNMPWSVAERVVNYIREQLIKGLSSAVKGHR